MQLSEVSLEIIFVVLGKHFSPKPMEVVASFKLNSRTCNAAETAANLFASLNKLADDCGFGMFRERMLRDRVVGGINGEAMQWQLLEIPDPTFDIAMEAVSKDSQVLSTPNCSQPSLALTNAVPRNVAVKQK